MRRRVIFTGLAIAIVLVITFPASIVWSADTGSVVCQVTPQLISVTISDGSVNYGSLGVSATKDATNDPQTITNAGNVTSDFKIKSGNATGGTSWTLASSPGSDQFSHYYSFDGNDWALLTQDYQTMTINGTAATNVAANATRTFYLKILMPTAVTDGSAKSITVTVQAVAHN
jgi:hypothetical protein